MTVIVISLSFRASSACSGSARATCAPGDVGGRAVQFVIYAIMVGGLGRRALSEIWGELQRAAGATERLVELLTAEDSVQDPGGPCRCPQGRRGEIASRRVFRYPTRPETSRSTG
jgi:ATP-binding cassette subfamily B protein